MPLQLKQWVLLLPILVLSDEHISIICLLSRSTHQVRQTCRRRGSRPRLKQLPWSKISPPSMPSCHTQSTEHFWDNQRRFTWHMNLHAWITNITDVISYDFVFWILEAELNNYSVCIRTLFSSYWDTSNIDVVDHFSLNQSRSEEITLKEDFGNGFLNLADFGRNQFVLMFWYFLTWCELLPFALLV